MNLKNKYFLTLDGLRAVCALLVMFDHWQNFNLPKDLYWVKTSGEPVCILFTLSGFFLAYLHFNRRFDRTSVANYLVARFARTYPAYLVAIGLVIALSSIESFQYEQPIVGTIQIIRHILLMGSSGVFWSISPEIQFYFFFLALWLFVQEPEKFRFIGLGIALLFCVDVVMGLPGPGILLFSKLPFFLFGTIIGYCYAKGYGAPQSVWTGACGLFLLVLFLFRSYIYHSDVETYSLTSAVVAAAIIYCLAADSKISKGVLGGKALTELAKISYSIYLFHVPTFLLLRYLLGKDTPNWISLPLSFAAVFLVASASFNLIEGPSRRYILESWNNRTVRAKAAIA